MHLIRGDHKLAHQLLTNSCSLPNPILSFNQDLGSRLEKRVVRFPPLSQRAKFQQLSMTPFALRGFPRAAAIKVVLAGHQAESGRVAEGQSDHHLAKVASLLFHTDYNCIAPLHRWQRGQGGGHPEADQLREVLFQGSLKFLFARTIRFFTITFTTLKLTHFS